MKEILLAVDGSEHSHRAAALAGELSTAMNVPVAVVNVVSDGALASSGPLRDYARIEKVTITQRELLKALGADVVAEAANEVRGCGGKVSSTHVLIGAPAQQIARRADEMGADCIVMGRRGLGDVGGLLIGSVSHKVGHLTSRTLITTE